MELLVMLWYSLVSVFKVIGISVGGMILTKAGILTQSGKRDLSNIVFYLFTPSLMFYSLSGSAEVGKVLQWWPLAVFPWMYALIGWLLGLVFVRVLPLFAVEPSADYKENHPFEYRKRKDEIERAVISSLAFHNSGNLPLTLIMSITGDISPFTEQEDATARGIAYVSIFMIINSAMVWIIAYAYLGAGAALYSNKSEDHLIPIQQTNGTKEGDGEEGTVALTEMAELGESTAVENNKPEGEELQTLLDPSIIEGTQLEERGEENQIEEGQEGGVVVTQEIITTPTLREKVRERALVIVRSTLFKNLVTPITFALLVGLVVGLIPPVKGLFYGTKPPLKFLVDIFYFLGLPSAPTVIVVLGASIATSGLARFDEGISKVMVGCVAVGKLIVTPLIGLLATLALRHAGWVMDDPLFSFVLIMQGTSPSATVLVIIAEIHGFGQKIMPVLQLWQYLLAIVSITLYLTLALYLLL